MWPFKRMAPHEHEWRLEDTFMRQVHVDPRPRAFFIVQCATCGKGRTFNETEFAHFRKYFNVKITEVSDDETA
ncbi:hypothetical protein D3C81_1110520 [compost metagenome]